MNNEYGSMTPGGFLPAHPSMDDVLKRVGLQSGFSNPIDRQGNEQFVESEGEVKRKKLLRDYAAVFETDAGRNVLEDLLDRTLRCSSTHPGGQPTLEECTVYGLRRDGQNSIVIWILSQLQAAKGQKATSRNLKTRSKNK